MLVVGEEYNDWTVLCGSNILMYGKSYRVEFKEDLLTEDYSITFSDVDQNLLIWYSDKTSKGFTINTGNEGPNAVSWSIMFENTAELQKMRERYNKIEKFLEIDV